jgi:hypothetical protein
LGQKVSGGNSKQIEWNLEADNIEIGARFSIKINVKAIPPQEQEAEKPVVQQEDLSVDQPEDTPSVQHRDSPADEKQFSRTGLILQSAAFPGLGLTRYKGGPHWIKGVAGYGCLAGSIFMNQSAVNTYDGIMDEAGYEAKNELFQKAVRQDQISKGMAYAAIAIWVSDLVWTLVGTSDLSTKSAQNSRLRVEPSLDPVFQAPLLSFKIQF